METRQDMSPGLRRRLQTGRICLDFTHTGGDGEFAKWELLHEPTGAARFLGAIVGTEEPRVRRSDMEAVLGLRRAVTTLARTRVATGELPAASIAVVNAAASKPSLCSALKVDGTSSIEPGTTQQVLSTLARDAIELFSSPLADRIRVCEADDCALLFVDASRPGRRRWCSMEWCGDRQKKRSAGRAVSQGVRS